MLTKRVKLRQRFFLSRACRASKNSTNHKLNFEIPANENSPWEQTPHYLLQQAEVPVFQSWETSHPWWTCECSSKTPCVTPWSKTSWQETSPCRRPNWAEKKPSRNSKDRSESINFQIALGIVLLKLRSRSSWVSRLSESQFDLFFIHGCQLRPRASQIHYFFCLRDQEFSFVVHEILVARLSRWGVRATVR